MYYNHYIATSLDYHMDEKEYTAWENYMKDTFMCPLCSAPHNSINGKSHSRCQIDDSPHYPEEWRDIL